MLRCEKCRHRDVSADKYPCSECDFNVNDLFEPKKQTNADRIRSFSDEELAELITSGELCAICPVCQYYGTNDCYMENEGKHKNCDEGIMQWLQSEVEE